MLAGVWPPPSKGFSEIGRGKPDIRRVPWPTEGPHRALDNSSNPIDDIPGQDIRQQYILAGSTQRLIVNVGAL